MASGLPTAVTLACEDQALGRDLVQAIGLPTFRPYLSDDIIGAEIGGALKNVVAIACGIVEGAQLGESARSALTTRGFAEIVRLGISMGAKPETMQGLSGLGDLKLPEEETIDPFTGEPLLMKKLPDGWVIYSVGKDLKDDGGKVDDESDSGLGPVPPLASLE